MLRRKTDKVKWKKIEGYTIRHEDIVEGGELIFEMGPEPIK